MDKNSKLSKRDQYIIGVIAGVTVFLIGFFFTPFFTIFRDKIYGRIFGPNELPPVIKVFKPVPPIIKSGQKAKLIWKVENAKECYLQFTTTKPEIYKGKNEDTFLSLSPSYKKIQINRYWFKRSIWIYNS